MTRSPLILIGILCLSFNLKASNFSPEEKGYLVKTSFHQSINCSLEENNNIFFKYIKDLLNKYSTRYEYLNKKAPLWIQKMDKKINKIDDLLTKPFSSDLLDANIKPQHNSFEIIINHLKNIDISLPSKSKNDFYCFLFSGISNNTDLLSKKINMYYSYIFYKYMTTAKKLHKNMILMHDELHRLFNECLIAYETQNFDDLQYLKDVILLEFEATYKDPIFTMLDN